MEHHDGNFFTLNAMGNWASRTSSRIVTDPRHGSNLLLHCFLYSSSLRHLRYITFCQGIFFQWWRTSITFLPPGEKENLADFPDLCMFLLGRVGQWVSVLFSALSLLGASAVYWVLMSNFLYHTVKYVYGKNWNVIFQNFKRSFNTYSLYRSYYDDIRCSVVLRRWQHFGVQSLVSNICYELFSFINIVWAFDSFLPGSYW